MKKFGFIIFIILFFIISCSNKVNNDNNDNKEVQENKLIRVGIYVYDTPFLYFTNNNLTGFDYDIINEVANISKLNTEFISMPFSELIPSLLSKKIDVIIAGMSVTDERKKIMNFSLKYYSSGQNIIINNDNEDINTIDDLIGKSVGVINGTISDDIISKIDGINIVKFDIAGSSLLSLKLKKVDAVMLDSISCKHYVVYDKDLKIADAIEFPEVDYAIAVRKEDNELLQKINHGLYTIMNNGVYNELINKHLR